MYVTFEGSLIWYDDDGVEHPLRQVKLVFNLYTTYTDDEGRFSLRELFAPNSSVKIVAYAVDKNTNVRVIDSSQNLYNCILDNSFNITTASKYNLGKLPIDMSNETGQAFQISQAVITARDFAKEMMGKMPSPVTVKYPFGTHAYYEGGTIHLVNAVNLGFPPSYASWDLIMHEYGHHIQMELNNGELLGKAHDSRELDAERYKKDIGIRLSWSESWPTVFGMIAQNYYMTEEDFLIGIATVGDSFYTAYNRIEYDINNPGISLGESCERSIIAVLWDLFDDDVEENDTIALGYRGFWEITTKSGVTTFSEFINNFYDTHPELVDSIGANLSRHQIAAGYLKVENIALNELPEFSWSRGGVISSYTNNLFLLKIYASNNELLFTNVVSSGDSRPKYTLDEIQWQQVLSAEGSYFYWTVEAMNDRDGIVTGPYIAQKQRVEKPFNLFTIGLNRSIKITSDEKVWFFKFTAPSTGKFTFYTEGGSDTYGEVYSQIFNYQKYLLASDDNSGDNKNFKIELNLQQNQCVYIKVTPKVFWLHYSMRVKQE